MKRHIAGTTMSSAIEKSKELNQKKLPVSISFLSDIASDSAKARYSTTTYLEVTRRIARMGLKASIQVPLNQIGARVSEEATEKNLREIITTANKYGVFVWLEIQEENTIPEFVEDAKGTGYAISIKDTDEYLQREMKLNAVKVIYTEKAEEEEGVGKKYLSEKLKRVLKGVKNPVFQSVPDKQIKELISSSKQKRPVTFEFQLGYSPKQVNEVIKKGARASVYVPFGKDWAQYAINKAPERYARFVATRVLKEA